MKNKFIVVVFLMFQMLVFAQQLNITGKVTSDGSPVENATVYMLKEKDSTIINYTSSSSSGNFNLKIDKIAEPTLLRITADHYNSYYNRFEKIEAPLSLGSIALDKSGATEIEAVVLTATAAPVKIKKDTVEFNAGSFAVQPDANIEQLVKQLPGFEIDADGKITSNGKDVDQILVNGKPFFDKDGQIALKNLPADIIKKVQVTGTKTKEEELNGEPAKSQNLTLNFTIDEKKNMGYMVRLTGGYGTDDRYEASGLASYFKNNTKISVLGASNNINSSGFSNDEIFDSMGNGRNSRLLTGSLNSGNTTKGVQKSSTFGINYSDKISDQADLENASIMFTDNNLETRSKVSRETYLPSDILINTSENSGFNETKSVAINAATKVKLTPKATLQFSTDFKNTTGDALATSQSKTYSNTVGDFLNEMSSSNRTESVQNSGNINMYFSQRFDKKGRVLSASLNGNLSQSDSDKYSIQNTNFIQTGIQDNRNQRMQNTNSGSTFRYGVKFTEPISDSAKVAIGVDFSNDNNLTGRDVNDFDALSGDYNQYNSVLSNEILRKQNTFMPEISYRLEKKKLTFRANFNVDLVNLDVDAKYNGIQYNFQKDFILPEYGVNFSYKFSDKTRLNISNSATYSTPSAVQLTPYQDFSNPLLTQAGNPNLKNTWLNSSSLNFNDFNQVKNLNLYVNANFTYYNNQITSQRTYDAEGKQYLSYDNISGNKSASLGFGATKTYKLNVAKFSVSPRFRMSYGFQKGFIDQQIYSSKTYSLSPSLALSYEIKDRLLLRPSYTFSYNKSEYKNYSIDGRSNNTHRFKLEMTNYFGEHWTMGNDFDYSNNSNIADGFKRSFYFWNASIGYTFLEKQLTAKIKVYDLLNQNQSVQRLITDTYIEDRDDLILKRYVMFSLTYKLNRFGGNKSSKGKESKRGSSNF